MGDAQRYQIQQLLAAGGMAQVYLGESSGIEGFRKKVAIKRVLPKLSANQDFINMFLDEARLCAYLNHSRCVQVFDIGQGGGSHFIVMEYVDGADLKAVLDLLAKQNVVMPVEVACLIAIQICEGLAYAHSACDHAGNPLEIVHRDISPHNVLMTNVGEVKLVDFGLAKASSHLAEEDEDIVKGKFGYLAPEVTLRQGVDHRVDIFAVGILLFEMLAGRRLFLGKTDLETFKQVQAAKIPDVRRIRDDVDDSLMLVLLKALARNRDERYQTADELAKDLAQVLFSRGTPVTYLDIAKIVRATSAERDKTSQGKKTPSAAKDAQDVIGELIIDALHGFSFEELDGVSREEPAQVAAPVSMGGFIDPSAWGLGEEFGDMFDPRKPTVPPAAMQVPAAAMHAPAAPEPPSEPALSAPLPPPRRTHQAATTAARQRMKQSTKPTASGPWWRRWFDG